MSRVGALAGLALHRLNRTRRDETAGELRYLFAERLDEAEISDLTRRSFALYYMRQVETMFFGRLSEKTISEMVTAEGLENIDQALERGNGVIMLLSHFGSFLLPLPYLGYRGYRVNQVTGVQRHGSPIAETLWNWRKNEADRLPVSYIQVGKFLRPIYDALRRNEIVTLAFDGRDGTDYLPVDILGRKALISPGPINLALRTGAAIVPTFVVTRGDFTHRIYFHEPMVLTDTGSKDADLLTNLKAFTDLFTGFVLKYPCHYGLILNIMDREAQSGAAKPFFADRVGGS